MKKTASLNGAGILRLLRDGHADSVESLSAAVKSPTVYVEPILNTLRHAGLIVTEPADGTDWSAAKIKPSPKLAQIQYALGFSLRQLESNTPDTLSVTPYFGPPLELVGQHDLFVLMPFVSTLTDVYRDHIVKVADSLGLKAKRGDDFFSTDHVMADIWRAIWFSKAIIADCTSKNPNVFYEIGVAHTIGRPVILITQNNDDVPFDLRDIRFIKYEFTPRGMAAFEATLKETLSAIVQDLEPSSPYTLAS